MDIEEIRKSLLETVDTGDEKLLRVLHSVVLSHTNTYELEQWQKDELDRRSKSNEPDIPWEEVKRKIRANHIAKYPNGNSNKD